MLEIGIWAVIFGVVCILSAASVSVPGLLFVKIAISVASGLGFFYFIITYVVGEVAIYMIKKKLEE